MRLTENTVQQPAPRAPLSWAQTKEVSRLAVADVRHEWRLSLCLMLAVAAIATPLLLFFGLKNGTVETLRTRLLENPVNLEILPNTYKPLDAAWFEERKKDPRVAFVVPHTRHLSAQADLTLKDALTPARRVDLRPTGAGDVLLSRYGVSVPVADQCVLTAKAAEQLKVQVGQSVECRVTREQGRAKASHAFLVTGILPVQASPLPAAYIPLSQLEKIEAYKDGRAVPEFGWPGTSAVAYPALEQALLLFPVELDALKQALLLENTGFASLRPLPKLEGQPMPPLPGTRFAYELRTLGSPAGADNVSALQERLRGLAFALVPLAPDLKLEIPPAGETRGSTLSLGPATALDAPLPGLELPPECPLEAWSSLTLQPPLRRFLVHPELARQLGSSERRIRVVAGTGEQQRSIEFPARFLPCTYAPAGMALAPTSLLGTLNLLRQRDIVFSADERQGTFLLGRRGYSGFRMYAASLEDVAPLAADLERMGINATTRADRIAEVRMFDKYLSLLFWLIAMASLIGGIACLISNMYSSVERKRKELAVLRLLGVHGPRLSLFPLVSVTVLSAGGMAAALSLFHLMSLLINFLFRSHLGAGESFCRLTLAEQSGALAVGVLAALLAGLAASRRIASIQPSESLRDE